MSAPEHHPGDRVHRLFAALGQLSVRWRWAIVVVWVAVAVGASATFPTLASVIKSNNESFLPSSVPSQAAARLASPLQKANLNPIPVVVVSSAGPLTASSATYLRAVQTSLRGVSSVVSVSDVGRSPDGQAEQLLVLSNAAVGGSDAALNTLIGSLETAAHAPPPPAGVSAHLAGDLADQVAASGHNRGNVVQLVSVLFILVLLFLIFRAVLAPFVTILPAVLVTQVAGPVIAELTKAGLQVSSLSQIMLIVLVLGAGTDYGLFLVFRVREEIRGGRDPHDAVAFAVSRVGESITFSAGTVIVALLSLLAATFGLYQSLGAPLAIAIAIMLLAGLTLQPALLAIFGRAVFWPSRPRPGQHAGGTWGRIASRVVAAPLVTLVVGLVVFGGLALAASGNKPAGFGSALSAPAGTDEAAGNAALAAHFPQAAANPTNLVFRLSRSAFTDPAVLAAATARVEASPLFAQVEGPLTPLGARLTGAQLSRLHRLLGPAQRLRPDPPAHLAVSPAAYQAYRATGQLLSGDGLTFQFETSLRAGDPGSTAALDAVPAVRAVTSSVAAAIGARAFGVAGEAPGLYDVAHVSDGDLFRVIPIAVVVIALLLALVMRSLVAPLYLIASVALSYLAALGVAVIVFIRIGGNSGLTFILPFLMFLFLLALGEDYNILVMTRIREEARSLALRAAVARAVTATGSTVTSAGMVLAGTFAVFAIVGGGASGGSQIRDVGIGLAVGVLMDTFLVRTLLVPSTVALLGRWNWWPSAMGRTQPPALGGASPPAELASSGEARRG